MGYFANGTEGEWYEDKICSRCIHYDDSEGYGNMCPVWEVHLLHNYTKEGSDTEMILNTLIPRSGTHNKLCGMWKAAKPEWENHGKDYEEWLKSKGVE